MGAVSVVESGANGEGSERVVRQSRIVRSRQVDDRQLVEVRGLVDQASAVRVRECGLVGKDPLGSGQEVGRASADVRVQVDLLRERPLVEVGEVLA